MKRLKALCLIICLFGLVSGCAGPNAQTPSASDSNQERVIQVRKTINVAKGKTFDGMGALYDWTGAGDCSQTEGMPPMFKLSHGATLQNLRMRNAPDGIHVRGSHVTISNIVNLDVCEDAISIKLDKNKSIPSHVTIKDSKFYDCEDKAIQITRGRHLLIKNNEFHNCAKALRLQKEAKNIRFEGNKIYNAKVAIKVSGGEIVSSGNYFDTAKLGYWIEKNGVLREGHGNRMKNVTEVVRFTEGGTAVLE